MFNNKPKLRNLLISEDNPFCLRLRFRNSNNPITYLSLSNYLFKAQIRLLPNLDSPLIQDLNCSLQNSDTELLIKLTPPFSNLLVPNISAYNIPPNFEYLNKDKLPDTIYYWSLRSFDLDSNPISRILEGYVLVTSETTSKI